MKKKNKFFSIKIISNGNNYIGDKGYVNLSLLENKPIIEAINEFNRHRINNKIYDFFQIKNNEKIRFDLNSKIKNDIVLFID